MKHSFSTFLVVLFLSVFLAACGGDGNTNPPVTDPPEPEAGMSQGKFLQTMTETAADFDRLASGMSESTVGQLLAALPTGLGGVEPFLQTPDARGSALTSRAQRFARSLEPFSGSDADLPRGTFTYNDLTGTWEGTPASTGNFVAKWSYSDGGTRNVVFTVDWDVAQPTVVVSDGYGRVEVPTDMNASLRLEGATLADINLKAAWFSGADCTGPILEPSSLNLTGYVGDATGRVDMDVQLKLTDTASGADTVSTAGDIDVTSGADAAEVTWNVTLGGTFTRGSDCFLEDMTVTNGKVAFGTSTTLDGDTETFDVGFAFDDLLVNEADGSFSVDLMDGVIRVNGAVAVTFDGTLDDSNGNGVPGENVTVRFTGGETTTLEALLQSAVRTTALAKLGARLSR